MLYRFADYELSVAARRLAGADGPIHLEPQVFDVLVHLVENRDRVVPKTELIDEIWGSRFVSESALTTRIKAVRAAVGDDGRAQRVVRTVHGRGYQFVEPVVETRDQVRPVDAAPAFVDIASWRGPLQGREAELDALVRTATGESLVTLVGPGGVGKTRLALEAADRLAALGRVVPVDLTQARTDGAVGEVVAGALGVESGMWDDVVDACCEYLSGDDCVVLLDNCEHVPLGSSRLISRVLGASATTRFVATSRRPLGVGGEVLLAVDPLPLPDTADRSTDGLDVANPAVALFVDRVGRVVPGFEVDSDSGPKIAALCRALDGMPLALELAASRMRTVSLDDMLSRLDRRLDILEDGNAEVGHRQRTLRSTLDWSFQLLDEESKRLFCVLSAYPAGLALDGVEWVVDHLGLDGDAISLLEALVDASLVRRMRAPSGTRYDLLETMRLYGLERLADGGEADSVSDAVAAWARHLTDEVDRTLMSDREIEWNDRVRDELPNLRAGRDHLRRAGRDRELISISMNLHEWARLRDVSEIWSWADELADLTDLDSTDRARVLAIASQAANRRGRIESTAALASEALELSEDPWATTQANTELGVAATHQGSLEFAIECWENRITIDDHPLDKGNIALCTAFLGDTDEALRMLDGIRAQSDSLGWPTAIGFTAYAVGEIESLRASEHSVPWLEKAIAVAETVGSSWTIGAAGLTLSTQMAARGETTAAARSYSDLIDHWLRSGGWTQQWITLRHAAALLSETEPGLALEIIDGADSDPLAPELHAGPRRDLDDLRRALASAMGVEGASPVVRTSDRVELAHRTSRALEELAAASAH